MCDLNEVGPHRLVYKNAWIQGLGRFRRCGLVGGGVSLRVTFADLQVLSPSLSSFSPPSLLPLSLSLYDSVSLPPLYVPTVEQDQACLLITALPTMVIMN